MNRIGVDRLWIAGVCAAAAFALFQFFGNAVRGYIDTTSLFYWWGFQWSNPGSESEHGWLILGLSAWLFWRNLRKAQTPGAGDEPICGQGEARFRSPAFGAMVAGLALHLVGFVAQQTRLSILAFLLFTWGVLRLAGGRRWGAAALFPLGFMVFAIPVNVLDSLGFWLRVWVVDASAWVARGAGIEVLRSGTQLLAPDGSYNYDVAAACSGLRSLTAMAALSLLAGYLNFQSTWRRALLLGLCFPLVYVGNVTRILAIIFAAEAGGPKWGDIAHEVMGFGVFAIVFGGVLGAVSALRHFRPEPEEPESFHARRERSPEEPGLTRREEPAIGPGDAAARGRGESRPAVEAGPRRSMGPLLGATAVTVLVLGEIAFLRHLQRSPVQGQVGVALAADGLNPVELPAFLGTEWIGRRAEVTAVEREILPPDTGYSRKQYVAVADPRRQVFLSIVLSGRDRTSIHRPELCLVGQGWTVVEATLHRFSAAGTGGAGRNGSVPATLLRVRREVQTPRGKAVVPQLVAYWFANGDGVVATQGERIWRDAWNRVLRGRADRWAYVLLQTDASEGEAIALQRMQAVLDGTLPAFAGRQ